MNYIVYTVKFGFNGANHQYTKKIGDSTTQIEFKEYFAASTKANAENKIYNTYYAKEYATFSITEELYKELNP